MRDYLYFFLYHSSILFSPSLVFEDGGSVLILIIIVSAIRIFGTGIIVALEGGGEVSKEGQHEIKTAPAPGPTTSTCPQDSLEPL